MNEARTIGFHLLKTVDQPLMGMEVGFMSNEVKNFLEANNELNKEGQLTQALACESLSVLGHDRVMKAFFGAGTAAKKHRFASEAFAERLQELVKKAYTFVIELIKKCLAWVKNLFSRRKSTPEAAVEKMEKVVEEVSPAMHKTVILDDARLVDKTLRATKLVEQFFGGLNVREYDILIDGEYQKKILELAQQVQYSHAVDDLKNGVVELGEWYARKLEEGAELNHGHAQLHGTQSPEERAAIMQQFQKPHEKFLDAMELDTPTILGPKRTASDAVFQKLMEVLELEDKLAAIKPLEGPYDLKMFFSHAGVVLGRFDSLELTPILTRWSKELDQLEEVVTKALKTADTAFDNAQDTDSGPYLAKAHAEYFSALNSVPERILSINRAIMTIYRFFDDGTRLFVKMMEYEEKALAVVLHEEHNEELAELLQTAKKAVSNLKGLL